MGLLKPTSVGFLHADAEDLDRKLREGDGVAWSGDPRLSLQIGVLVDAKTKRVAARRYEVWRECEDGMTRLIGHWRMEEFDRILLDIAVMAAGARGDSRVKPVAERIDEANAAIEKQQEDEYVDKVGPVADHLARLAIARSPHEPAVTFYGVNGLRDEPKDETHASE